MNDSEVAKVPSGRRTRRTQTGHGESHVRPIRRLSKNRPSRPAETALYPQSGTGVYIVSRGKFPNSDKGWTAPIPEPHVEEGRRKAPQAS